MQNAFLKSSSFAFFADFVTLSVLAFLVINLYRQNRIYQSKNRRLIILNDAVMSVNIELNKQMAYDTSEKKSKLLNVR